MNHYEEEKSLLQMKGDALRMKLQAQTRVTKADISSPFSILGSLQHALKEPVTRSLLFAFFSKRFLTIRSVTYLGLGATALYLLSKQSEK